MGKANIVDKLVIEYNKTKDKRVLDEIVENTKRLSYKLAHDYKMNVDDINYIYGVSLMKALEKWDSKKGTLFTSYLVTVMQNELKMEWRKKQERFERNIQTYGIFFYVEDFCYDEDNIIYDILLNDTIEKTIDNENMKNAIKMFVDDAKVKDITKNCNVGRTNFYNKLNNFKNIIREEVEMNEIYV